MVAFRVAPARALHGQVRVPGDKSIGHRALLFAALTDETVWVHGVSDGADNGRTAKLAQALGARFTRHSDGRLEIRGRGLDGLAPLVAPVYCGNSGTTIRLAMGLLAGQPFASELTGDASLSARPMKRVIAPLTAMGARITGAANASGDIVPPLQIAAHPARLGGMAHHLAVASAQVKTALLLAGLYADGTVSIHEPGPSRDHSERMLAHLGAPLVRSFGGDARAVAMVSTGWNRKLRGGEFEVPGDPSSAAFLLVAACLLGAPMGVTVEGITVNPTRTGFLDILARMGAAVRVEPVPSAGAEPLANVVVRGPAQALRGVEIFGDEVVRAIDELPILAVAAACATGTTVVRDAEELRVKESDRIAATCAMLRAFGVTCEARADGFMIEGVGGRLPQAGHVDAVGDHRIAMAGAIAAMCAQAGDSLIDDVANVATSYPAFAETCTALGAPVALA